MMETIIWYFEFNLDGRKDDRRIEMKKFLYSHIIYSDFHSNSLVSIYLNSSRENFLHKFIWYWMSTEISVCDCTLRYCVRIFCINYSRISTSKRSFLALFATPLVFSHSSHISHRMNFLFIFFLPMGFSRQVSILSCWFSSFHRQQFFTRRFCHPDRVARSQKNRARRAPTVFPWKVWVAFQRMTTREEVGTNLEHTFQYLKTKFARVADDLNLLHVLV